MKFSEEYKSAMNKISPDEQTARRIENAVLERISVPEKAAPAKKKKPFYVYAGAFSGAAAARCWSPSSPGTADWTSGGPLPPQWQ